MLFLAFGTPALAWAPETRVRQIDEAVRLLPASLRLALESHRRALLRGVLEPMKQEDHADHRAPWSDEGGTTSPRAGRDAVTTPTVSPGPSD